MEIVKVQINRLIYILAVVNMALMISDYKAICNYVGIICSLLIIFLILLANHFVIHISGKEGRLIKCIFLFFAFFIISSMINGSFESTLNSVAYYLIEFTSIFLFIYYERQNDYLLEAKFIRAFFFIWDIFCVISIFYYIKIPDLARLMAAYRSSYANLIIGGGYPMAYGSVVLAVFLFQLLISGITINTRTRIFYSAEIILFIILVYYTNSFICMIAMFMGFCICLIGKYLKGSTLLIALILFSVISVFIYYNLAGILSFFINSVNSEFITRRLTELYDVIANDVTSYHLDKRSSLYEMSFASFLESPIFGVGYRFGNVSSLLRLNGIGSHSTLLDVLGQYGLLGSIPLYYIFIYPVLKAKEYGVGIFYLFSFFIILALNPSFSTYHFILVTYFIIPLISRNVKRLYCLKE